MDKKSLITEVLNKLGLSYYKPQFKNEVKDLALMLKKDGDLNLKEEVEKFFEDNIIGLEDQAYIIKMLIQVYQVYSASLSLRNI